ncbi:MAG: hypothetical protein J1E32_03420 [Treponema sp.]|nr:hypothetical protein [Treponema sp.]
MLKNILIGGAAALICVLVKELCQTIDDYNALVDKYNESIEFIRSCDFYRYSDGSKKEDGDAAKRFVTETETLADGTRRTAKRDAASGLTVISYERA